jgi:hypothetical protein
LFGGSLAGEILMFSDFCRLCLDCRGITGMKCCFSESK